MDELIQIVAETNFIGLAPENSALVEDGLYFIDKERVREINQYDSLLEILEMLSERPASSIPQMKELRTKIAKLEYVGAKKSGSAWYKPNKFSFNLSDIL